MFKIFGRSVAFLLFLTIFSFQTSFAQNNPSLKEGLEVGTKPNYYHSAVNLSSGNWNFSNAIIANSSLDKKNGKQSIRLKSNGFVEMNFDYPFGITKLISIQHGIYGNDTSNVVWSLYCSADKGQSWQQVGDSVITSNSTLKSITFIKTFSGSLRFQIRHLHGSKLNIDDIVISGSGNNTRNNSVSTFGSGTCNCSSSTDTIPTRDDNLAMGNPSNATTNTTDSNNYLISKSQYTVSYNNAYGVPNWSSWHLSSAWKGSAARCDCFTSDATLPTGYTKIVTGNYTNTGFDRGHLCPSEDRDSTAADNKATFIMTNITPQSPVLNQQTWASFETYCRKLMSQGNELYIIAGGYGSGGESSNGGDSTTISKGKIRVYARFWKVAIILPVGTNDVNRVTNSTRVIAIDMPNKQNVNANSWGYYRVSVDAIEAATGYNLLSNVPTSIQNVIEASADTGPTN